jgi:hypothetical protein
VNGTTAEVRNFSTSKLDILVPLVAPRHNNTTLVAPQLYILALITATLVAPQLHILALISATLVVPQHNNTTPLVAPQHNNTTLVAPQPHNKSKYMQNIIYVYIMYIYNI